MPFCLNYLSINILGHNFTFGSPGKFEFNFSGIRPKSPSKVPKSPGGVGATVADDDESGSEPEEDEGEHIYFQVCYSPPPHSFGFHCFAQHQADAVWQKCVCFYSQDTQFELLFNMQYFV
jgi:hypothetical protein